MAWSFTIIGLEQTQTQHFWSANCQIYVDCNNRLYYWIGTIGGLGEKMTT